MRYVYSVMQAVTVGSLARWHGVQVSKQHVVESTWRWVKE